MLLNSTPTPCFVNPAVSNKNCGGANLSERPWMSDNCDWPQILKKCSTDIKVTFV